MPVSFLDADAGFPQFTKEKTEDKIQDIQNYLYMLLEQLRYSLRNIGAENFNEAGLKYIGELITKPITIALEDEQERRNQLEITVEGLTEIIGGENGAFAQYATKVDGLYATIADENGDFARYMATVDGLSIDVNGAGGKFARLQATVDGFTVSGTDGITRIRGGSIDTSTITARSISAEAITVNGVNLAEGTQNRFGFDNFGNVAMSGAMIFDNGFIGDVLSATGPGGSVLTAGLQMTVGGNQLRVTSGGVSMTTGSNQIYVDGEVAKMKFGSYELRVTSGGIYKVENGVQSSLSNVTATFG